MTALARSCAILLLLAATSASRSAPIGAGDIAPDFTLEAHDGRRYTLSAERGRRPVVLVFYRGHW